MDDPYDLDAWRALGFEFGDGLEVTAPAGYDGPMPPADRATCRACDGTYPESAWGFDGTTPPVGRAARSCPGCGEWAVLL